MVSTSQLASLLLKSMRKVFFFFLFSFLNIYPQHAKGCRSCRTYLPQKCIFLLFYYVVLKGILNMHINISSCRECLIREWYVTIVIIFFNFSIFSIGRPISWYCLTCLITKRFEKSSTDIVQLCRIEMGSKISFEIVMIFDDHSPFSNLHV